MEDAPVKHIYKRLTAVLLVLAVLALMMSVADTAQAVSGFDADRPCNLTVHTAYYIPDERVQIDLYKIASVEEADGEIVFKPTVAYTDIASKLNQASSLESRDLSGLAQEAAQVALNAENPEPVSYTFDGVNAVPCFNMESGAYLIIIHGEEENYVKTLTDDEGNEHLATTVTGEANVYIVNPSIVILPRIEQYNTVYDVGIVTKAEPWIRYGSLEITKILTGFVGGSPATFVFQIEATLNGQSVYSDVIDITFTDAGDKSVVIDNLPVGAEVVVTEVYSGACYRLVSDATQTVQISVEECSYVSFTNEPTGTKIKGGGITNRFSYGENGWDWTPVPHSS